VRRENRRRLGMNGVGGGERLRMDYMQPRMACSSAVRTDA